MSIRIVLVGTTHPGNIGAVARAMKNMGLDDLVLVNPRHYPHEDATARASLGLYSNKADIDQLVEGLHKVKDMFS